jgi:GNAT superfamily N-acetyltransferase
LRNSSPRNTAKIRHNPPYWWEDNALGPPDYMDTITIRPAIPADAPALSVLLAQLGYPDTEKFIDKKLAAMLQHADEALLVAEREGQVLGMISLHFIPQIALEGDFCRISYLCVDDTQTSLGIGKLLEEQAEELARTRGCDRIEVHCHGRRVRAHQFYGRQGYEESPKYLMKSLRRA